jgi:hypothetical protein
MHQQATTMVTCWPRLNAVALELDNQLVVDGDAG